MDRRQGGSRAALGALLWGLAAAGPVRAGGGPEALLERRPVLEAIVGNWGKLVELRKTLDLSPEQKVKFRELFKSRKPEVLKVVRAVRDGRRKVLAKVRAETPDEAGIQGAVAAMTRPLTEAALLRARIRREAMAILTPTQRGQVDAFISQAQSSADEALQELEAK